MSLKNNIFKKIKISEEQISNGKYIKANTSMSDEEIDNLLLSK